MYPDIKIVYIGGIKSIEREIITNIGVKYFPIETGKLRRYFSIENLTDFFRFALGIFQSIKILRNLRLNSIAFLPK